MSLYSQHRFKMSLSLLQERGAGESSLVATLCWLKYKRVEEEKTNLLSHVWLFGIPWTVAHQTSLSMGAPGARILVGHHFLLQGIFSIQTLKMGVLAFQAVSLPSEPPRKSRSHFWWGLWGGIRVCSNTELSDQLLKETRKTTASDMDFVFN